MDKKPNFLFFITDQQRADWLGCAGHPVVKTPHIDAIAARGTRFTDFNVAMPVCMPNRASLLTGRYPSVHGLRYNGCYLSRRANTFVDVLNQSGYTTAAIGKSHLQPFTDIAPMKRTEFRSGPVADAWKADDQDYTLEEPQRYEEDRRAPFDGDYYGYQHVDMFTGHGDQAGGHYRQWFREHAAKTGRDWAWYHDPENQLPHNYSARQSYRTPIPESLYPTFYIRDQAQQFIENQQGSDAPFFTFVSFPDPHHPFNPPGRYWDMYQPDAFELPIRYGDHRKPPPPLEYQRELMMRGELPVVAQAAIMEDEQAIRESLALTAGMITMVDDAIGAIVETLKESGQYDSTVICFNSDHGDYLGDSDLLLKGAWPRDSINRVPFIWSDPEDRTERCSDGLASTIDISTTILDRAGIAPYFGMQGTSLLPAIAGEPLNRESLLIEFNGNGTRMGFPQPARVRTLRTKHWRLSQYKDQDWGELFDLDSDPDQLNNLWDDPAHIETRAQLSQQLLDHMIGQMDESPRSIRLA